MNTDNEKHKIGDKSEEINIMGNTNYTNTEQLQYIQIWKLNDMTSIYKIPEEDYID